LPSAETEAPAKGRAEVDGCGSGGASADAVVSGPALGSGSAEEALVGSIGPADEDVELAGAGEIAERGPIALQVTTVAALSTMARPERMRSRW